MGRKEEAAQLLKQGLSPSQIGQRLGTSTITVMQYLWLKMGEGELRRTDIIFALDSTLRHQIEQVIEERGSARSRTVLKELQKRGIAADRDDVAIYLKYRRNRVVLGDMYELLRNIEVRLHRFIKQACIAEFGEDNWWRGGVPDRLRADCAAMLERDTDPASEPYCYVYLLGLREILDKSWGVLSKFLPKRLVSDKKELLERITRLNRIRNAVMHPVRNDSFSEDDFEFVRKLEGDLGELQVGPRPREEADTPGDGQEAA